MAQIYLVEDDEGVTEPLAGFLIKRGHKVYAFDSATRALEFLKVGPVPDVVLLDLLLRADMNGWQFIEEVRQIRDAARSQVPIIAMSAAPLTDADRRQLKADAFLPKPFELMPLLELIDLFAGMEEGKETETET